MLQSSGLGGSIVIAGGSGGKNYAYNNIGVAVKRIVDPNPQRVKITFYNPGSVAILISPEFVQGINTAGNPSNVRLTPTVNALGGCWLLNPSGGYIILEGECSGAYQAFAVSGSANPLTVSETNV